MGGFSPWHYYSGSNAILWGTENNGSGLSSCVFTRTEKQLQKQFKAHPVFLPIPREKNTEHQEPAPGRDWKHFCLLHLLLLASPGETALDGMLYLHGEETKQDAFWWWRLAPTACRPSWHLAQGSSGKPFSFAHKTPVDLSKLRSVWSAGSLHLGCFLGFTPPPSIHSMWPDLPSHAFPLLFKLSGSPFSGSPHQAASSPWKPLPVDFSSSGLFLFLGLCHFISFQCYLYLWAYKTDTDKKKNPCNMPK